MGTIYVTPKNIPADELLIQKLDLMIKRCVQKKPKTDNLTQIEGGEGVGKTTMSAFIGYYVSCQTGRPFSEKNVFFDTKKALEFAQSTFGQIIILDEPAKDFLSTEWFKDAQKDMIKLLMMARKKRHFFIFNFTKFWKFSEYIVVDRATCMIHLFENQKTNRPMFSYIGKSNLERLYNDYKSKKMRTYRQHTWFMGSFADVLDPENEYNILDIFDNDAYEKMKDKAIQSIGKKEVKKESNSLVKARMELKQFKKALVSVPFPINSLEDYANKLGIAPSTIHRWGKITIESSIPEDIIPSDDDY